MEIKCIMFIWVHPFVLDEGDVWLSHSFFPFSNRLVLQSLATIIMSSSAFRYFYPTGYDPVY